MSYSKMLKSGAFDLIASYLQALYLNPIRTKSLTSCVIASLGNLTSQKISGSKEINVDSLWAFGMFGLWFGGTVPHFFFEALERLVPGSSRSASLLKLLIERFLYAPLYQAFALYVLGRLEKKDHATAKKQMQKLYWDILLASWKWLSVVQFLNLFFVPPVLRVLVVNVVGFFWSIFLATKRRKAESSQN